jgi:APA family basic amino acid/polyamine antiporter
MQSANQASSAPAPHLQRGMSLLHATALNMVNMVGAGPFITIPLLMSAMGGPQSLLGWFVAAIICIPDGMVWSELGASMPGSGGTYRFLREGYGPQTWGRLMAFLFIWQFVLSGPLEIASGYIGFGNYMSYIWPGMTPRHIMLAAMGAGLLNIVILYRGIRSIGKLTVALWISMLLTVGWVIITGASHFNPRVAFDFPPNAFRFSYGFFLGLGSAATVGIYDYLGYYDVCYIGEEVRDPGRSIPRSIIISVIGVASLYFVFNLSVIGNVSWREFVPASEDNHVSKHLVSVLMERFYGAGFAKGFTALILITTYSSVFALLLGYSRIPYAAAQDGYFFSVFGRLHPKKAFPYVSLLAIGAISILACLRSLEEVIKALITCRILIQFMGQIFAVVLLRRRRPDMPRPYRIWLYPIPCLIAFFGWTFVFATSDGKIILFSLLATVSGVVAFAAWSWWTRRWPFGTAQ